jgi:hypothetical protein
MPRLSKQKAQEKKVMEKLYEQAAAGNMKAIALWLKMNEKIKREIRIAPKHYGHE